MSDETNRSESAPLPDNPSLEWLRKQAKSRLAEMRESDPSAKLASAQFDIARHYGFSSWRALKEHIDSQSLEGQLFAAARKGDVVQLTALLDEHPAKLNAREKRYGWTLLHAAAHSGQLAAVNVLLERGLDANVKEKGDDTYPMHWAAAAGQAGVVRRLADAGGDVIGRGDDHNLEVIGWATCWEGCDDDAHREVVKVLLERGARHHIYSAIAMNFEDEVRRIVASDPSLLNSRMSRNENNQMPLHFAVRMKRPAMVSLLLSLGADPLAVDGSGYPAAMYADTADVDAGAMQAIRTLTSQELASAVRGGRTPRITMLDLAALVSLGDFEIASRIIDADSSLIQPGGAAHGVLHLMARRGDIRGVRWLLQKGADPNGRWRFWDADVTPLHVAVARGDAEIVRILLTAGSDPALRDSAHDGDAMDWAEYFKKAQIAEILRAAREGSGSKPGTGGQS